MNYFDCIGLDDSGFIIARNLCFQNRQHKGAENQHDMLVTVYKSCHVTRRLWNLIILILIFADAFEKNNKIYSFQMT